MKRLSHILLALACALPIAGRSFAAQDQEPTAGERYTALNEEVDEAYSAWSTDLRAKIAEAKEAGEELPKEAYKPPFKQFVPKFQAGAKDYAGTEDAVPFLSWLARQGMDADPEAGKQAVVTLIDAHLDSKAFARMAPMLPGLPEMFGDAEALALLAKVEKNTTSPTVRAWAVLARLSETLEQSALGSDAYEAAKKEMRAAMEGVEDRYLASQVGQKIDVRERFSIGMVSPDIEGIDLDGTAFKLSDYEGKVIFLDFWGDW